MKASPGPLPRPWKDPTNEGPSKALQRGGAALGDERGEGKGNY